MSDDEKLYMDGHEIKVCSRLYHIVRGWGTVVRLWPDGLRMEYDNRPCKYHDVHRFTADGKYEHRSRGGALSCNRAFFWDEVKITPPPKPKKKEVRYQWLMRAGHTYYVTNGRFRDAGEAQIAGAIPVRPIEETREEYEVPEWAITTT